MGVAEVHVEGLMMQVMHAHVVRPISAVVCMGANCKDESVCNDHSWMGATEQRSNKNGQQVAAQVFYGVAVSRHQRDRRRPSVVDLVDLCIEPLVLMEGPVNVVEDQLRHKQAKSSLQRQQGAAWKPGCKIRLMLTLCCTDEGSTASYNAENEVQPYQRHCTRQFLYGCDLGDLDFANSDPYESWHSHQRTCKVNYCDSCKDYSTHSGFIPKCACAPCMQR
mmetsp:Transcript_77210/g.153128  ORF Transcript_77210/g.153128 Transcript_77210/m.153128 type:complete len:221 (-) Transcript_77210:174-836(-)